VRQPNVSNPSARRIAQIEGALVQRRGEAGCASRLVHHAHLQRRDQGKSEQSRSPAALRSAFTAMYRAVSRRRISGLLAFALISPLQMRVVNEAAGAPSLASTLNQGAFNLGNATGAWIGDVGLTHGLPYDQLPWIGAALAAVALLFTIISYRRAQAKIPSRPSTDA